MSTQDRVAIFGGTFDPFTIAHREICREAIDKLYIDKLYVIPTVVDYHRQGKDKWLDDSSRITVAKRMLWSLGYKYLDKWEIDDHEIRLKRLCEASNASLYNEVITPRRFISKARGNPTASALGGIAHPPFLFCFAWSIV